MNLKDIIEQQAQLARNSGGEVTTDSACSTVSIVWDGDDCFMQGVEADQFIDAVRKLSDGAPDANFDDCELCEAWQYIENLSN